MSNKVKEYWDSQAELGEKAGTQDLIAKELTQREIEKYVKDGMTILDAGCGNGMTAISLARKFEVNVLGVDYSAKMVEAAVAMATRDVIDSHYDLREGIVQFWPADISQPIDFRNAFSIHSIWGNGFDLVYTERAIINLPDWEIQRATIELLCGHLKPGGFYLMCECSESGLRQINHLREQCGLAPITPPWHNRYIIDEEIEELCHSQHSLKLVWRRDFSSTYYFLSRVVNAWLARREGLEPSYDAPINQLAFHLPPLFGDCAQMKMWVWERS